MLIEKQQDNSSEIEIGIVVPKVLLLFRINKMCRETVNLFFTNIT